MRTRSLRLGVYALSFLRGLLALAQATGSGEGLIGLLFGRYGGVLDLNVTLWDRVARDNEGVATLRTMAEKKLWHGHIALRLGEGGGSGRRHEASPHLDVWLEADALGGAEGGMGEAYRGLARMDSAGAGTAESGSGSRVRGEIHLQGTFDG